MSGILTNGKHGAGAHLLGTTMTLAPLVAAAPVIQLHVGAALVSLVAGSAVMISRKGTTWHRRIGWMFVTAMSVVAVSSLFIMRQGHFSGIHLLTLLTLVSLPLAVLARRAGRIGMHRQAMIGLFAGLAIAGAFTLKPGRLMNQAIIGSGPVAR